MGHSHNHVITLIPAWMDDYIQNEVWDEITYQFWKFNSAAIEIWKPISNFVTDST